MHFKLYVIFVLIFSFSSSVHGINGGALVKVQDYKYTVGVLLKTSSSEYFCGGGIIGKKFVLTAAHCFAIENRNDDGSIKSIELDLGKVKVYANTESMETISEDAIKVKAYRIYFLKEYFKNGHANIAILELKKNLDFSNGKLQILNIPRSDLNDPKDHERFAALTGFGDDRLGPENTDHSLKLMNVQLIDKKLCKIRYDINEETRFCGFAVTFGTNNIFPKNPLGACGGDVGNPLVRGDTILGITIASPGGQCDNRDAYPALFTRVPRYVDFINYVISGRVTK